MFYNIKALKISCPHDIQISYYKQRHLYAVRYKTTLTLSYASPTDIANNIASIL